MTGLAWDAIVIGAGHNGLVTAAYLAKGGLRTLVLERRERAGGIADTVELSPGARVPALLHTVGRLRPKVMRDLELKRHGLTLLAPEVRVFAPSADGSAITLWGDVAATTAGLRARSAADADAYEAFDRRVRALGGFLADLGDETPPDIAGPGLLDALSGLRLGRAYRGLGRLDGRTILRVLPMAVADFVAEAFETDALRAAIAWRGVRFASVGPWSGGTTANLLTDSAGNDGGAAGETVYARGGPGALTTALVAAARAFGAEVRTDAEVTVVATKDGRVTGVVLAGGEEIAAASVVSAIDPKRTLLDLLDPVVVGPTLRWRAGNIRQPGVVAKVNLVLAGTPRFPATGDDERPLRGRIVVAPGIEAMERAFDAAKYGRPSDSPIIEATLPSLADPALVDGAPAGTQVMSVLAQYAPYRLTGASWEQQREAFGDAVMRTLEAVAPGISALVTARQVLTPPDLEREYGLGGGHLYHAEPALDAFFLWRPLLGHARYRLPVEGLYLCGSGAHPGGGITGWPGQNAAREIMRDAKRRAP
ncbi:MAG: phytoene desaturase family protein [Candidatus Limnocylindrales bacterium]